MLSTLSRFDTLVGKSRPAWLGLGQLAIALLGVHLAADRLDDHLTDLLVAANDRLADLMLTLGAGPITPDGLATAAAWSALFLELLVLLYMFNSLTLTAQRPTLNWPDYKASLSPHALALPLLWAPASLAGAWVVGMAAEDTVAAWHTGVADWVGPVVGAVVAWRLSWTGWRRVVGSLKPPKRRLEGLLWAPLLLCMGALAGWYGLPIRGWFV